MPIRSIFHSLILVLILAFSSCQTAEKNSAILDLSGSWQFHKQGDSIWLSATVPGTVQTDLFYNKIIEDPFYSDNEKKNKWIENENWIYKKSFALNKSQNNQNTKLVFEGLDTYASVFLNGQNILTSDNMFRTCKIDIESFLIDGENELEIIFESPVKKAIPIYDALPYRLPADNDRNDKQTSVFTRKAPYQYGWDWGPRYVTMGIWRPVYLQFWPDFEVLENRLKQISLDDNQAQYAWITKVKISKEVELIRELFLEDEDIVLLKDRLSEGIFILSDTFNIKNPKLWWPNGYGDPSLYFFKMNIKTKNQTFSDTQKLGFRSVELINDKDSIGESFYFKVNGIPIYAKGANYIPQDNFLPNVDSLRYQKIAKSVKDANMNMLRVWGGGIYENDIFYDLCDENGIMVWQDFMFACSLYPGDSAFLQNVEQEAQDNIKRLCDHPSLALWCGNNEINELWYNWGYQKKFSYSKADSLKIWGDYQNLFNFLLPNLVEELNPEISYWESSPKIGWGHPESLKNGDSHYWGIWWGKEPFEVYENKIPRFSSEFGFQSFPQISTLLSFADSSEMKIDSKAMQAHQKSSIGNQTIVEYMERDFPVPQNFEDFVYVSQLVQAFGLSKALEAQRRAKPRSMGSLFWQLNDCWPGISWSSLDYYGNWKVLHYEVQHDFKTFLVSFEKRENSLNVYIVSDSLQEIEADLKLRLLNFGGDVLFTKEIALKILPNSSSVVYKIPFQLIEEYPLNQIVLEGSLLQDSRLLARNNFYFASPKDLNLQADIEPEFQFTGDELLVWSKNGLLIKNLFIEAEPPVHFSKNFFDILPQDTISLKMEATHNASLKLKFNYLNRFFK